MNGTAPSVPPPPDGRMWARHGLDPVFGAVDGICVEWRDRRWTRVEPAARPPADYTADECRPEFLLTPGLLNAHVHLDYSFLRGRLPEGVGFAPWLRQVIDERRALIPGEDDSVRAACRDGLLEALEDGVTALWDIGSLGWGRALLEASALDAIGFVEWIAPDARRWQAAWDAWLRAHAARLEAPAGAVAPGISPHALYTVCPPALQTAARWARQRGLPLAIHLAESPEERELWCRGQGALSKLMAETTGVSPKIEATAGDGAIARAEQAGLLASATLAIHCNLPEAGDAERLARSGAVVVFCPRSHRYFGYPEYPMAAYRHAGVRLALGTDSLASNWSLSLRAEAREVAGRFAGWSPPDLLALATGAALGDLPPFGGRGRLAPGLPAQWALWAYETPPTRTNAESLTALWLDPATRCVGSSAAPSRVIRP